MSKPPTELRDWSSASEALFRSARGNHAPTAGDRERVRNALAQRLADVPNAPIAGVGADALLNVARKSGVALSTLVKIGLGLGVVMAGVLVFLRASDSPRAVNSKPEAPASVEGARVAAPAVTPRAAQPAVRSNEAPIAVAAESSASANAVRRSRDRGSLAIGSARARSGTNTNDARSRDGVAAQDYAAAPAQTRVSKAQGASDAIRDAEVGAAASTPTSGSKARAPARTGSNSAPRTPARPDTSSTARSQARSDGGSATRTAVPVDDDADRVQPSSGDDDSLKRSAAPSARAVAEPASAELDPSDPRAELFFVRRIQAAVRDDDPRKVLSLCAEHERRWPRGTFVQEREGLRAVASCQSGTRDASARAAKFFDAYPRGPLAPRVREACGSQLNAAAVAPSTPASGEVNPR